MFAKKFFVFIAALVSFAGAVFAQQAPSDVKPLSESVPQAVNSLITKRAAAEALLQRDSIKMIAHIKDNGGHKLDLEIRAYPQKGKMLTYRSAAYCEVGLLEAKFSITPEGNVAMERLPRYQGCSHDYILIDPLTKNITIYRYENLSPNAEAGGLKVKTKVRWTLED